MELIAFFALVALVCILYLRHEEQEFRRWLDREAQQRRRRGDDW
jgi:hypothetical protein